MNPIINTDSEFHQYPGQIEPQAEPHMKKEKTWISGMQDWRKLWKWFIDDGTTVPSHCAAHDSSSPSLSSFVYAFLMKEAQLWYLASLFITAEPRRITVGAKWKKLYIHKVQSEKWIRKNTLLGSYMPDHRQVQLRTRSKSSRTADRDILGKKQVFLGPPLGSWVV